MENDPYSVFNSRDGNIVGIAIDLDDFAVGPLEMISSAHFGAAPSSDGRHIDPVLFMGIKSAVGLPGDFNDNGIVDAADYTVWRDSLGQTGAGLAADGDNSGTIDQGDYDVWKANFGNTLGAGSGSIAQVPEPSTTALAFFAWLILYAFRRRP